MDAWLVEAERLVERRATIERELADVVGAAKRAGRVREETAATEERSTMLEELAAKERKLADMVDLVVRAPAVVSSGVVEALADPEMRAITPASAHEILQILPREIDDLRVHVAALSERTAPRPSYVFDDRVEQKRADRLAEFLARLDALESQTIPAIRARALRAVGLAAETIETRRTSWDEAIRTIADRSLCPDYEGLQLSPQLGLVPLGRNPDTRLYEFWHVLSGDEPVLDTESTWRVEPTSGLVLVLIPGATTVLGCQSMDRTALHYDTGAERTEEPSPPILLAPFFLSKYEMTQGQWIIIDGANPSRWWPGWSLFRDPRVARTNPVENVSWTECHVLLGRVGLVLPTEAQWEYAARGRGDHPFGEFDRFEEIASRANWGDRNYDLWDNKPSVDTLDDGYSGHASVGSFPPNGFGLFDVFGNVSEWCRDWYKDSCTDARVLPGSGERVPDLSDSKVLRGGSFAHEAEPHRVARRFQLKPAHREHDIGVRPARALDP
jgi:formylglycine-generating enzyme required for sulfatase activity